MQTVELTGEAGGDFAQRTEAHDPEQADHAEER